MFKSNLFLLGKSTCMVLSVCSLTGCIATSGQGATMDEYDPRNNIPLLPAATKSQVKPSVNSQQSFVVAPVAKPPLSQAQKLRELKMLRDEGVLTQKEYEVKKTELLKSF